MPTISSPCQSPIAVVVSSTSGNASHGDMPRSFSSQGSRQPAVQTTAPIDRSMPPVTITNAAAMLRMPNIPMRWARFSRL